MFDSRVFFGLSDRVIYRGRIRWVGFHDFDGKDAGGFYRAFREMGYHGFAFQTGNGWHFVTLEILSWEARKRFYETMQYHFPSDYRLLRDNCLRLSAKNGAKPVFGFQHIPRPSTTVSGFHVRGYRTIIPRGIYEDFIRPWIRPTKTYGHFWQYAGDPSGVMEVASHDLRRIAGMGGR